MKRRGHVSPSFSFPGYEMRIKNPRLGQGPGNMPDSRLWDTHPLCREFDRQWPWAHVHVHLRKSKQYEENYLEGQGLEGFLLCPGRTPTHLSGVTISRDYKAHLNCPSWKPNHRGSSQGPPFSYSNQKEVCPGQNSFVTEQEGPRSVACDK